MTDLYDIARQVTDEVLGAGTYAEINKGNSHPGVQATIARGRAQANEHRVAEMAPEPSGWVDTTDQGGCPVHHVAQPCPDCTR